MVSTANGRVNFTVDSTPPQVTQLAIQGDDGEVFCWLPLAESERGNPNQPGWQGTFAFSVSGAQIGSPYSIFTDFPVAQSLVATGVVGEDPAHTIAISLEESEDVQRLTVSVRDAANNQNDPGSASL